MTNVWTFTGHLGRDGELRKTPSDTSVLSFAVPVKSGYGDREQTDWVDCAMFGKRAEGLANYLKKGVPVTVTGEVRLETFQKRDGTQGSKISVNVSDVTLQSRASGNDTQGSAQNNAPADLDDDVAF